MKFDDFDKSMRIYETNLDQYILPGIHMVIRLDGRGFTAKTRDPILGLEAPFDERFSNWMSGTTLHLMKETGFNVVYGYTQSDEISLLLHINDNTFNRKTRKINSILAGHASAKFTHMMGSVSVFDSRVSILPSREIVQDYFEWRQLDATRNALNSWCYWTLRKDGFSARQATSKLENATVSDKNELLFSYGINFNDLPLWQKRGIGFYWELEDHNGVNPLTKQSVTVKRRRVTTDKELPSGPEYRLSLLQPLLANM